MFGIGMMTGPDDPGAPMWTCAAVRSTMLYTRELQLMVWALRSNVHCAYATAALFCGGTSRPPEPLPESTTCCAPIGLAIVNAITVAQDRWDATCLPACIIDAPLLNRLGYWTVTVPVIPEWIVQ